MHVFQALFGLEGERAGNTCTIAGIFCFIVFGPEIPALLQVFMLANSWLLGVRGLTSDIGSAMGSLQQIVYDMHKEADNKLILRYLRVNYFDH